MKIQVLNNISKTGLDILKKNKFVICDEGEENFSGIVLRSKISLKSNMEEIYLQFQEPGPEQII